MSFRQHAGVAQTLVALCLLFGMNLPSRAQEVPDTGATPPTLSVVVTARKRDEPEISVPAAMTTFRATSWSTTFAKRRLSSIAR